ncbi:MAG: ATP-binding protein, partial [Bacteroidetes bacterium]
DDPNEADKVDVVIIELKKLGLNLAKQEEIISQLKQRARRLVKYFPNKIQRVWFYGVIDFSKEFIIYLKENDYFEIYSKDKAFYGEEKIISIDKDSHNQVFVGINLISFDAFWKDAESRNSTFLKILKDGFRKHKPSIN